MKTMTRVKTSAAAVGIAGLASLALVIPAQATTTATTYQATLKPVALNTPAGAASGHLTLTLNGNQATVMEQVNGLATTLPADKTTLAALGIPAAFAGKPFPHVQHVHINGKDVCPTPSADTNHDGVISTVEGQPAYGMIGTTLSTKGSTGASAATNVLVAPGGGNFTYKRTFTMNQATLTAIQNNKAVIVVHGLNPANAPKASLSTPNSLNVTLPGESKKVAVIATAPALCGPLEVSQMSAIPGGAPSTGFGGTAGIEDEWLFGLGAALIVAASGVFVIRRRFGHLN